MLVRWKLTRQALGTLKFSKVHLIDDDKSNSRNGYTTRCGRLVSRWLMDWRYVQTAKPSEMCRVCNRRSVW